MSVRINPCHGCPAQAGCDLRAEFRRRVSGLGLRSATFDCKRLDEALCPGRRVLIATPVVKYDRDGDFSMSSVAVPATITGSNRGLFTCVIDKGHVRGQFADDAKDIWRFRKKMRAARIIRFLDEPMRELCKLGHVKVGGVCDVPDGESCLCEHLHELEAAE